MGRLELKLLAVLVLLTGLPLAVAFGLSGPYFDRTLGVGLNPAIGTALEDAVQVYGDFVRAEKARQQARAEAAAAQLRSATQPRAILDALVEDPRAFYAELVPRGGLRPLRVASKNGQRGRWRRAQVDLPLAHPDYARLHYGYGLEQEILDRFERMEAEVIQPFLALSADRDNVADAYAWSFVGSLAAALLFAGLVSITVARRITQRLERLRRGMSAVAAGALDVRVQPTGRDEVAELIYGFNDMARTLEEAQARLQYLGQVSAWQGIARRLAHEIKNPLTPILLAVQQVHRSYAGDDERFRRTLDTAHEIVDQEVANLQRLVENFSRFARLPKVEPVSLDVVAFAREVASGHPEIEALSASLPEAAVFARIDRGLMRQALSNLLKNGAEAARDSGVEPTIELSVEAEGAQLVLAVSDNGPGVPASERERIFEPYVTGKEEGTGLGLAIVKKIVVEHAGDLTVTEATLGGARFEIRLPLETQRGI